jgi:anthranilate synthase component 1
MSLKKADFLKLAGELTPDGPDGYTPAHTHIPVAREILADLDTPVSTYIKLADRPYSYLLESVQGGDKWSRYSIIGLPCRTIYRLEDRVLTCERDGVVVEERVVEDPLVAIRELHSRYRVARAPDLPQMYGGLVGYFGYETVAWMEGRLAGSPKPDPVGCPDAVLMVSEDVLVFDNISGRLVLTTLVDPSSHDAWEQGQEKIDAWITRLGSEFSHPDLQVDGDSAPSGDDYEAHFPQPDFEAAVDRCKEYIRDGDIMQVVISQRLSLPYSGRPMDVYRALRTINPSPYMYLLNVDGFHIVGSSPEILVRVDEKTVTVRPIAGTRRRSSDPRVDHENELDLLSNEKELAEHLMLIDLGRNDVGRIAETGSVELTEKMIVERYSHVMHIVSNVEGKLREGLDVIDVLAATFPAGTVSGAPKIRAMEIIAELEPLKRGVYSGAVGYLGWHGNMDMAIAIRTAIIKDGTLYIQAGGGIVADSVPRYEWRETISKASAMISAVEMATRGLDISQQNAGEGES